MTTAGVRRNYAAERWAAMVGPVLQATEDPRTLAAWGRLCGLSASSIKVRCRAVGLKPKRALDFCRLLRVVTADAPHSRGRRILEQLDIVDERTIRRLFQRAGLSAALLMDATAGGFLSAQRLVTDPEHLKSVRGLSEGVAGWTESAGRG